MKKYNAVGANIFAGGFTLGVSKHFNVLGHLEHDEYGVSVSQANFPGLKVFVGVDDWPAKANKPVHFLYANPPCAIWSVASGRGGDNWKTDPRLQRIRDIFDLVEQYRPRVWAWESVCQAWTRGSPFVNELILAASKQGYSATTLFIDARWLGAPQIRKRFFLVLHRVAIDWELPSFSAPITAGEALRRLPKKVAKEAFQAKLTPEHLKLLRSMKAGDKLRDVFDAKVRNPKKGPRGQTLGRPSFLVHRLLPDAPSYTVIGCKIIHPTEDRHLSVAENAALCGFPSDYDWSSAGSDGYNQVARGVMPPVGEWLARNVYRAIEKDRRIARPARFYVDLRNPPGVVRTVVDQLDLFSPEAPPPARARKEDRTRAAPAKEKRERTPRAPRVEFDYERLPVPKELLAIDPNAATSGEYIRAALKRERWTDEEIAAATRKRFEGRKTTISDVAWNRRKLRVEEGAAPERITR